MTKKPPHDFTLVAADGGVGFRICRITDKSYWPNEARQSVQARTGSSQGDLNSAFAYDRTPSRLQPVPNSKAGSAWRYQGGPKSR